MEHFATTEELSTRTELQPNYRIARAYIKQLDEDNPPEYQIIVTELRYVNQGSRHDEIPLPYVSRTFRVTDPMDELRDVLYDILEDTAFDDGFKCQLQEVVRRVVFAAVDEQRKKESD